jgi:hypothetical protein
MTGLWVALSVNRSSEDILAALKNWFSHLEIGVFNKLVEEDLPWPSIVIDVVRNESEFPVVIQFYQFPGPQDEQQIMPVMTELAGRFSDAFQCRTICDGSGYGDDDSPYWSVIWDHGVAYLADDGETLFGDGEGGPVRIVRKLDLDREPCRDILRSVLRSNNKRNNSGFGQK